MAEKSGGLFSFFKAKTNRAFVEETVVSKTVQQESVSETVPELPAESSDAIEEHEEEMPQDSAAITEDNTAAPKRHRVFPYSSDPLQTLYYNWLSETDQDSITDDISSHMSKTAYRMENDSAYSFDVNVKRFFMTARIQAKKRLFDYNNAQKARATADGDTPEYAANAEPIFYLTPDGMMLLTAILPPIGNGQHIQADQLTGYIKTSGIQNGVLNPIIQKIVDEKSYFKIYPLAIGTLTVHGKDGEVIDRFPREKNISYGETDFGNMDFTSHNTIREVSKDDIICDIIAPTKGTDGKNIRGQILPARNGKKAHIPMGKNTVLSPDETQLLAANDGYIKFQNGNFHVIQILDVPGNVDFSTGNLNYSGGVVIHGDVLSGFEINAGGDVEIYGVVEAARITSGGNITIHNGMNGNFAGELNAKGDIRSPFLENTLISTEGNLYTNSLICCDVFCDGTIYANSKMGIVIGGSLTAMHAIKARVIGNKAGRKTELTLGTLPHAVKENDNLDQQGKQIEETIQLLTKNINYLRSVDNLPEQKVLLLKQLEGQLQLYTKQKESLTVRQDTLQQQFDLVDEAMVEAQIIYPVTAITISGVSSKITTVTHNAKIALNDDGAIEVFPLES